MKKLNSNHFLIMMSLIYSPITLSSDSLLGNGLQASRARGNGVGLVLSDNSARYSLDPAAPASTTSSLPPKQEYYEHCPAPSVGETLDARNRNNIMVLAGAYCQEYKFDIHASMNSSEVFSKNNCERYSLCVDEAKYQRNPGLHNDMKNLIAKDFIKNRLEQDLDGLHSEESVRKYALGILGDDYKNWVDKLGKECVVGNFGSLPQTDLAMQNGSCDMKLVDNVFESIQKKCTGESGPQRGCFSDYAAFKEEAKNTSDARGSFVLDYLDSTSAALSDTYATPDKEYTARLFQAIKAGEFKNLSPEKAMEKFEKKFLQDDIILNYTAKKGLNRDNFAKSMSGILKANYETLEGFSGVLNSYRSAEMKLSYGNGDVGACRRQDKMLKMCFEAARIAKGRHVDWLDRKALARYLTPAMNMSLADNYLVGRLAEISQSDQNELALFLNEARCRIVPREEGGLAGSSARGREGSSSSSDDYNSLEGRAASFTSERSYERNLAGFLGGGGDSYAISESAEGDLAGTTEVATSTSSYDAASSLGIPSTNNYYAPMGSDYNYSSVIPSSSRSVASEINVADNRNNAIDSDKDDNSDSKNNASDDQMNSLMKRLAEAEKRVEKLKTEQADSGKESDRSRVVDTENELIKELRSQIAELKEERKASNAAKVRTAETTTTKKANPASFSAGNSTSSNSYGSKAGNENAGRSSSALPSSGQSSSVRRASSSSGGGGLSLSSSGGEVRTATLASGGTLTRIDGLSKEKARQAIVSRIKELKGTSFLIEEDGKIKEIIAEMENGVIKLDEFGNPIYKTVEVGLAKDKKYAVKEEAGRKPAAVITDSADLKRDQEEQLKRERAEYEKLKGLTRKLIKQ